MGKKTGNIFKRIGRGFKRAVTPSHKGGLPPTLPKLRAISGQTNMPLPAVIGTLLRGAGRFVGGLQGARGASQGSALSFAVSRALGGGGGFRRRKRQGLTVNEMGKIMFLSQALGKRSPAVTLAVMKAMGGKI